MSYDAAMDYWEHGYNVIPVLRGSKKPIVKWKPYQTQRVTEDEINTWFNQNDHNLAVVCGKVSGVVVVDADNPSAITHCLLSLPITPLQVSTRKGRHFYYRHPGRFVKSRTNVLEDPTTLIDIRADGGAAMGYGSVHETGFVYQLHGESDMVSAADLPLYNPMWFPESKLPIVYITNPVIKGDAMERASRYMAKVSGVGEGQRNATAFRLAAMLTHDFGLSVENASGLLADWNRTCEPPLSDRQIQDICASGMRYGTKPQGQRMI